MCDAQIFTRTVDVIANDNLYAGAGRINITQDPRIDTLISRSIAADKKLGGMEGFRIQIYRSGERNAREEADKARAKFINAFPDIETYPLFEKPNYFKVRVGDYRTRLEAAKPLYEIRKVFKDAYIIEGEIINFPDLNKY